MTISKNDYQLDKIFEEWLSNQNLESPLPLKSWIDQYPQYSHEFILWASNTPALEHSSTLPPDFELEDVVMDIGWQTFLLAQAKADKIPKPIHSLIESGKMLGLQPGELAQKIGIGKVLLARFSQRLIMVETVPSVIIMRIAETLQVQIDQIRDYLTQPPQLKAGVSYKADQAPRVGEKQTFLAAVETDPELSPEEKLSLLDMK